ncbi:MAG: EamA family transporter [Caldilineae bacterium]|nr:MAG: EamA family transporter [Caldilineae bacterium]
MQNVSIRQSSGHAGRGMVLVMLAAMLWGTVTVGVKLLYNWGETTPLTIGWLRLTVAAPALFALAHVFTGASPARMVIRAPFRTWGLLLVGAFTMAAYQVCLFAALTRTSATVGAVLALCSAPVFAAVLGWPLLGERPTRWVGVALVGAILGTALLSRLTDWRDLLALDYLLGNVLALGAGLSYALYSLAARGLVGRVNPWHIIAIVFGGGSLMLLPWVLATGFVAIFGWGGWGVVLYLGLAPTALAYIFHIFGLRTTPASVATLLSLLEPLTATGLAFILLGERLQGMQMAGAILLLASLGVLYWKR